MNSLLIRFSQHLVLAALLFVAPSVQATESFLNDLVGNYQLSGSRCVFQKFRHQNRAYFVVNSHSISVFIEGFDAAGNPVALEFPFKPGRGQFIKEEKGELWNYKFRHSFSTSEELKTSKYGVAESGIFSYQQPVVQVLKADIIEDDFGIPVINQIEITFEKDLPTETVCIFLKQKD